MRRLKILSILIIVGLIIILSSDGNVANVYALDNFQSSAKAMCVLEKDSGRVLFSKNMEECLPMASTTKIVTAITVIQNCKDLNETIEVNNKSIGVEGSSIYLRKGEQIKVIDLLYGLMLRSGNDSAVALACHVGGDEQGFARLMNETAKRAGAINSNFITPHGLDHKDHYTTAHDLAKITAYALNNPIFKEIVSTKMHIVEKTNVSDKRYMSNKNRLLSNLQGCCGVKTGYTKKAGRCLVSAIDRNDTTYVCVVLNLGPMFEEIEKFLNIAYNTFKNVKVVDKEKEIYNEYIIDENAGKLYLYAEEDFYYPLLESEKHDVKLEYSVHLDNAKEGEVVGEIKVFFKNDLKKTIKLITMNKIDKLIDSNTLEIREILWEEKGNEN